MNENLYNYLVENNFLVHGIGEVNDEDTFFKFESILKNGGLMSLKRLKELGINVVGKVVGEVRDTPKSKISLFNPSIPSIKKQLLSNKYYYFLPFHPNVIFFIIDTSNINAQQHPNIPFEVNVDGFISIDSFKGVIAPTGYAEYLNDIQNKYDIHLPIYDFDFNITNNIDTNVIKK